MIKYLIILSILYGSIAATKSSIERTILESRQERTILEPRQERTKTEINPEPRPRPETRPKPEPRPRPEIRSRLPVRISYKPPLRSTRCFLRVPDEKDLCIPLGQKLDFEAYVYLPVKMKFIELSGDLDVANPNIVRECLDNSIAPNSLCKIKLYNKNIQESGNGIITYQCDGSSKVSVKKLKWDTVNCEDSKSTTFTVGKKDIPIKTMTLAENENSKNMGLFLRHVIYSRGSDAFKVSRNRNLRSCCKTKLENPIYKLTLRERGNLTDDSKVLIETVENDFSVKLESVTHYLEQFSLDPAENKADLIDKYLNKLSEEIFIKLDKMINELNCESYDNKKPVYDFSVKVKGFKYSYMAGARVDLNVNLNSSCSAITKSPVADNNCLIINSEFFTSRTPATSTNHICNHVMEVDYVQKKYPVNK